jgi:hypothetical protein
MRNVRGSKIYMYLCARPESVCHATGTNLSVCSCVRLCASAPVIFCGNDLRRPLRIMRNMCFRHSGRSVRTHDFMCFMSAVVLRSAYRFEIHVPRNLMRPTCKYLQEGIRCLCKFPNGRKRNECECCRCLK